MIRASGHCRRVVGVVFDLCRFASVVVADGCWVVVVLVVVWFAAGLPRGDKLELFVLWPKFYVFPLW